MRAAQINDAERPMARLDMVFAEQTGRAVETIDLIMRDLSDTLRPLLHVSPPVGPGMVDEMIKRRIDTSVGADEDTVVAFLNLQYFDPTQVELIVLNLAINARDAMPWGGRLTITTANTRLDPPRRTEEPAAKASQVPPAKTVPGSARVLLVDDDEPVRETTATILERLGYSAVQADGAPAALRILNCTDTMDLLLTDVAMPGMSGPDLARQALATRPCLPVVFISGFADPEKLAGATRMQRLVRKPFRAATLAARIEGALAEASVASV